MDNFLDELHVQCKTAEDLADKIEREEVYMDGLKAYLPSLTQTVSKLFAMMQNGAAIDLSQDFVLQVLNDIVYGIEHEDAVCRADVLRYGLVELFDYVTSELQREE